MTTALSEAVRRMATDRAFPDGTLYQSLSVETIRHLAAEFQLSGRRVEIVALEQSVVPERYARNLQALSLAEQIQLLQARVGVVGLGGLGGAVIEILARTGVGSLILIDGDRFEDSNLNRQFLCTRTTANRSKAEAAAERVARINDSVQVDARAMFLDAENADRLLKGATVLVDCLDNIPTRFVLADTARTLGCPLVSAAVAGGAGFVTTVFPRDTGLEAVFGPRDRAGAKGLEATLGCLSFAVTALAALEAAETIKALLGRGTLLRHRLMTVDLFSADIETLDLG